MNKRQREKKWKQARKIAKLRGELYHSFIEAALKYEELNRKAIAFRIEFMETIIKNSKST